MKKDTTKELEEIKERLNSLFDRKEITGFYLMFDRGFEDYEQEIRINFLQMCIVYQTIVNVIAYLKGCTDDEAKKCIEEMVELSTMHREAGTLKEMMEREEDDE